MELVDSNCSVDFIDINMGCPIDVVVNRGAGSALLTKPMRMKSVIKAASGIIDRPLTVKVNFFFLLYGKLSNFSVWKEILIFIYLLL